MIFLLCILLLFGLIQSLLELEKDNNGKFKWNSKRILSILYICGFVIGVIIVIIQEKESNTASKLIKDISSSVNKINTISNEQLNILSTATTQTQFLINKSDSVDKRMIDVLKIKESLIKQYESVNDRLSTQLELETKQLKERAPSIGLMDYDISLEGTDSTSYFINACIRNYGKRNAAIMGANGYLICFDKKNEPIYYNEFRGNNIKSILEPNDVNGMRTCYRSYDIKNLKYLKSECDYAVICLKVNYEDIAINKDSIEFYYSGWIPRNGNNFGGLKDWQYGYAKKWALRNLKIYGN